MSANPAQDAWENYLKQPNPYMDQLKQTNAAGKQLALDTIGKNLTTGINNATAVAGASGLSGAGGRTQGMINNVTQNVANQSAQAANQYDTQLANTEFADAQHKSDMMNQYLATQAQAEANKPKWYDYLLGGIGTVASALPGVGKIITALKKP